jgi:hypothetical protein
VYGSRKKPPLLAQARERVDREAVFSADTPANYEDELPHGTRVAA